MATKTPDAARSTATAAASRISDQMRAAGHDELADAVGLVEDDETFGVGLPADHPLTQQLMDLEFGGLADAPQPFIRQEMAWNNGQVVDDFHEALQW